MNRSKKREQIKSRIKEIDKELAELRKQQKKVREKDYEAYAQSLIDKTFKEFAAGGRWTDRAKKDAEKKYMVVSLIGRIRHLWAGLTKDRAVGSQQVRRGSNAPIQGIASEIGVKASRCIMEQYYIALPFFRRKFFQDQTAWSYRLQFNRIVHDASYFSAKYYMVIPLIHIAQYEATYGVTRRMEEEFGVKFTIEPEIEMELGVRDDNTYAWDWSLPDLIDCVYRTVKDAHELGLLSGTPEEVVRQIMAPYRDKECIDFLQKHYPLLGVKDLHKQIANAVPDYLRMLKSRIQEGPEYEHAVKDYKQARKWFA